jgi:hypothetical protein
MIGFLKEYFGQLTCRENGIDNYMPTNNVKLLAQDIQYTQTVM